MTIKLTRLNGRTRIITTRTSLFAGLNLADFMLTAILVSSGNGVEGNPLLADIPLWGIGLIKIAGVALVTGRLRDNKTIMLLLNIGMGLIVTWNVICIFITL